MSDRLIAESHVVCNEDVVSLCAIMSRLPEFSLFPNIPIFYLDKIMRIIADRLQVGPRLVL